MVSIKRALIIGVVAAAMLASASAPPAGAALLRDTPVYTQSFTEPGAVGVEGPSSLPYSWAWFADKPSSGSSRLYGYFADHSAAGVQVTLSRLNSDPEGEIGKVSGIAFDSTNKMLYVADTANNRILWYPRLNNTLPGAQVNYAAVGQTPGPVSTGAAPGTAAGQFDGLGGITVFDSGTGMKLIAAEKYNHRIQVFDAGPSGLSSPQTIAMPTGADARDVSVDPVTGVIYVAMTDGGPQIIQVFSSAGADLGRFGNAIDNGTYDQIDFDPDKHVIYASKAARVDVISPQSREILGSYMFTQFSEAGLGGDRMVKFMDVLGPSGQLFVNRFDPSGVLNGGSGPEDPTPAQSYLTPNPPTCTPAAPLEVGSGNTLNFTPNCTDPDGSTNQEFMVVGVSRGTAETASDYDSIDFSATGGGVVTLEYRVWTIDGISPVYQQIIYVSGATKVASELLPGRGVGGETFSGGTIANEGVGGLAKYLWYAASDGSSTVLAGYDQVDAGGGSISTVDCGSSPVGELGNFVSGIAYTSTNLLLAADHEHDRVVAYPRQDNLSAPVDCDNAISISSVSGRSLIKPRSLAINGGTAYAVVSADLDPDGGIVSFDPETQTENGYIGYSFADVQLGPLAFGGGHLFAGVNGAGLIEVFNPNLTFASGIGPLDAGSPDDFVSLSAHESTNRLFAMKPDEVDIFSLSTGTLLGKIQGAWWGGNNSSISTIQNYQQFAISSNSGTPLRDFWSNPNPVCTPDAPKDVAPGASITFTPNCTDQSDSTVREFTVTNSQTRGGAAITPDRKSITYTAGTTPGADDIAYRVQTQDGLSVEKHQTINVVAPAAAEEKPVVRETANLQLDSGEVFVKLPGSDQFVKLTEDMLIPVGTIIDARGGKAHITMANKDGSTYDGIFWEGVFQVLQGSGNFPVTTMKLRDDFAAQASATRQMYALAASDPHKAMIARRRGKKKNGLWGNAKGKYKTSGKGGSAAVRGTIWYVADFQCGSLFKVKRGKVLIDPAAKGE